MPPVLLDQLSPWTNDQQNEYCEFKLDSGTAIMVPQRYVSQALAAGSSASGSEESGSAAAQLLHNPRRKLSLAKGEKGGVASSSEDEEDKWGGVLDFCQALDNAVVVDHEIELFAGKRILEIGFCTGLPSALASRNGAKSIYAHTWDKSPLDDFVRLTLRQNSVSRSCCKFGSGDLEILKRNLQNQKSARDCYNIKKGWMRTSTPYKRFDVVLAPELLCMDECGFEGLHELLDLITSTDGIILLSARLHYSNCSGNLPAFLDLLKLKGLFFAHIRWISSKPGNAPRKVVQITRAIR